MKVCDYSCNLNMYARTHAPTHTRTHAHTMIWIGIKSLRNMRICIKGVINVEEVKQNIL